MKSLILILALLTTSACGGSTYDNEVEWMSVDQPAEAWDYDDLGTCTEYHLSDHRVVMVCPEVDLIILKPDCERGIHE